MEVTLFTKKEANLTWITVTEMGDNDSWKVHSKVRTLSDPPIVFGEDLLSSAITEGYQSYRVNRHRDFEL